MTTRGIERLKEHGIPHEVLTYQHEVKGVRYAAQTLGLPDEIVIKSLILQANDGAFIFALMSGDGNVSEKKLARASGHKRVAPASPHDAERVTASRLSRWRNRGASQSGHQRRCTWDPGSLVRLALKDLIELTDAIVADIRTG
jgi:prolyl-tRNA editing enzyme YbaK/EbsC (Cys-tRNA(Pro) deacylase)